jgi:hypothetical protein
MSNKFKARIRDRYKGRGNCWVKVPKDSEAYDMTLNVIESTACQDYINHIEREGFAWIRFSKPVGSESDPRCLFEVRYNGAKIDHPDSMLDLPDSIAETLPLLGNTPVKLQLEIEPVNRKVKVEKLSSPKRRKSTSSSNNNGQIVDNISVENKLEIIQEATLTKPATSELREWEAFLKAEGLLEYSI